MIDFVKIYVHFGLLFGNFARNQTARNSLRHKDFQTSPWKNARIFSAFLYKSLNYGYVPRCFLRILERLVGGEIVNDALF